MIPAKPQPEDYFKFWESQKTFWESQRTFWESQRYFWESQRTFWESERTFWESQRTLGGSLGGFGTDQSVREPPENLFRYQIMLENHKEPSENPGRFSGRFQDRRGRETISN